VTGESILIADDDRSIRVVLDQALGRLGYRVRSTDKASTLWQWIGEGDGDLVITDVLMPDGNGLDLIPGIRKLRPELRIIAMSAQNTLLTAVRAAERGAFDYLAKPFDLDQLVGMVERALRLPGPPEPAAESAGGEGLPLIGRSPAMQAIYRVMARLMASDLTVTILGESGTGKELVARALHDYGKRRRGPFIAVNMAAIPRELIESELFGHEKGAFTGALGRGVGRFEQAAGGTLFLDEIGDMPPDAQTRLLRVLQDGEFTTVGGRQPIKADLRIVAATHRDLRQAIRQGQFREDLFYRLNVVPIRLPPLRERKEDIADLARHFLAAGAPAGEAPKALDAAAQERLKGHSWPGNVRELENLMRRMAVLYSQPVIGADIIEAELAGTSPQEPDAGGRAESLSEATGRHLRQYFSAHQPGLPASGLYDRVLREVERPLLAIALEATRGNQIKAAELLGINRNTLRKKIRELDIEILRRLG
jgi:two-component system nitrogen regulation response regulator GlnG